MPSVDNYANDDSGYVQDQISMRAAENQAMYNAAASGDQTDAQNYAFDVGGPNQMTSLLANYNSSNPSTPNIGNLLGGGGYGTATSRYAPYDVGGGKTKWDEFVQQMQLENDKLAQAKLLQEEQLAQQKALEEEKLKQEQGIADQNTVEAFDKQLMSMQGPADPYGYLFASRGMAAPRGYSPTPMALPNAVANQYKSQGIDLSDAQKQLVGSSGPSFIQGYLGSMAPSNQQGPGGSQNMPSPPSGGTSGMPQPNQPMKAAQGMVVPGYAPGQDTVPALLSPGEGVLKPQVVQQIGGPQAISALNSGVQRFAEGGTVDDDKNQPDEDFLTRPAQQEPTGIANRMPMPDQPVQEPTGTANFNPMRPIDFGPGGVIHPIVPGRGGWGAPMNPNVTNLGNGLYQWGQETGNIRASQATTGGPVQGYDQTNTGVPIWGNAQMSGGEVGTLGFGGNAGFTITGPPIGGVNNLGANNVAGSTQWYPVKTADGRTGYVSSYDIDPNSIKMPQIGDKQSMNPNLPGGYQMQAPGVATRGGSSPIQGGGFPISPRPGGPTGIGTFNPSGIYQVPPGTGQPGGPMPAQRFADGGTVNPIGSSTFGTTGISPTPVIGGGFSQGLGSITPRPLPGRTPMPWEGTPSQPILSGPFGPGGITPTPMPGGTGNPSAPLLTGGVLQPSAPPGGPPMNLNMLDPYTRSLVDQYGRPQVPSAQALANMPQSGIDAYKNYVEKVAGGNFQDLLDQSKQMTPSGSTTDFSFS